MSEISDFNEWSNSEEEVSSNYYIYRDILLVTDSTANISAWINIW